MGISWLCREEIIHIDEGVFSSGGIPGPGIPGKRGQSLPFRQHGTTWGCREWHSPAGEDGRSGKRGRQGGGRPASPFTCEFSSFQGGDSAFRIIHWERKSRLISLPMSSSPGRGGVFGWWDIPSGLYLLGEKILQTGRGNHLPRTSPGIMKEGFPRIRLHPFLPSTHYGTTALLPFGGIEGEVLGNWSVPSQALPFPMEALRKPPFTPLFSMNPLLPGPISANRLFRSGIFSFRAGYDLHLRRKRPHKPYDAIY